MGTIATKDLAPEIRELIHREVWTAMMFLERPAVAATVRARVDELLDTDPRFAEWQTTPRGVLIGSRLEGLLAAVLGLDTGGRA